MKATETLHERGQSLWLDNITRDLLDTGTLARYVDELSVTGLTSNPTIFDHAIKRHSSPRTSSSGAATSTDWSRCRRAAVPATTRTRFSGACACGSKRRTG